MSSVSRPPLSELSAQPAAGLNVDSETYKRLVELEKLMTVPSKKRKSTENAVPDQPAEIAGVKMPQKKKAKADPKSSKDGKAKKPSPDISNVHLDGEETNSVPVFETCDEVRKKINAYLKKPGVTQAQFCRDLHAQFKGDDKPASIRANSLSRFREQKGPRDGATCNVFYSAYVFFEKIRVAEGKAKSKHRQEMEGIYRNGLDRTYDERRGVLTTADNVPYMDKLGQYHYPKGGISYPEQ